MTALVDEFVVSSNDLDELMGRKGLRQRGGVGRTGRSDRHREWYRFDVLVSDSGFGGHPTRPSTMSRVRHTPLGMSVLPV